MSQALNNAMYAQGRADALSLSLRAPELTGTELIAEEVKIPAWSKTADYSNEKPGIAVSDEGQVWILLIPHRAADYEGRPSTLRALWGLAHTTDPAKAKPWVASYGISGLYMRDECCTYEHPIDGLLHVNRSTVDNNAYPPYTLNAEDDWEDLGLVPGQELPEPEEPVPDDESSYYDELLSSGVLTGD